MDFYFFIKEKESFINNLLFILCLSFFITLVVNVTHEFGHWIMGTILGGKYLFGLNNTTAIEPLIDDWRIALLSLAGPVVNIIWSYIGMVIIMKKKKSIMAWILTTAASLSRLTILLFSFIIPLIPKEYQDEYYVATLLNLPIFSVMIIVSLLLIIALIITTSKFESCYSKYTQKFLSYSFILLGLNLAMVTSIIFDTFVLKIDYYC